MGNPSETNPLGSVDFSARAQLVESGVLSPEIAAKLFDHWERSASRYRSDPLTHYLHYFVLLTSIQTNLLYFLLYDRNTQALLYEFGLKEVFPFSMERVMRMSNSKETMQYKNQDMDVWHRKYSRSGASIGLLAFFPAECDVELHLIKIKNLVIYYHFDLPKDTKIQDLFEKINREITGIVNETVRKGQLVSMAYFKFESLEKYLEIGRGVFIDELEERIVKTMRWQMGADEHIYPLSPREYLLIAVNRTQEETKNILKRARFEHRGLPLIYETNFFSVDKEIDCSSEFWKKLDIERA